MKTYEIKTIVIEHPKLGKIEKQSIVYYDNEKDPGTPEFYKEGETDIRPGYSKRNI